MNYSDLERGPNRIPILDLNEILFDHPGAGFIFQLKSDMAIVDCAASPANGSLVLIQTTRGFMVDTYRGQHIFGVVTHLIRRIS
jgi:hypothetical protein